MFNRITIYRITAGNLALDAHMLGEYLARAEFVATTPNQEAASGFEPPRAKHGAFVEAIGGHWIARSVIETRKVPADALQRRIDELAADFETRQGYKPGSKARRELKEWALNALLPQAFPKQVRVPVWIDPAAGLLMIGSTSAAQIDRVITDLVRAVPELNLQPVNTKAAPFTFMVALLVDRFVDGFDCGRDLELRTRDESKAAVRYKNRSLDTSEVQEHLANGMWPVALSMCWDGRVGFTLTDSLALKSIELLEVGEPDGDDDAFDAEVAITTGELSRVIKALVDALGGYLDTIGKADTEAPQESAKPLTDEQHAKIAATAYNPDGDGVDPLIDQARVLVVDSGLASIAYTQRKLLISYNRAARLLEALEIEGVVGPMGASGMRQVLAHREAAPT